MTSSPDLPALVAENKRLRAALTKIADYSPASTVQPVAIAREAIAARKRQATQQGDR